MTEINNIMKSFIKKLLPEKILIGYHFSVAYLAAFWFGFPTKHMAVIGITGTKGKTSSANFVWSVLTAGGYKVGLIGTANIRIGSEERMNPYHMTMPKPFVLQKILREMKDAGCTHVVMEATSEGMKLGRHIGIYFDIGVFTNLSPEHLPNHGGSFEKYKEAKATLFRSLNKIDKVVDGRPIPSCSIINADDPHGSFYTQFFPGVMTYGINLGDTRAYHVEQTTQDMKFFVDGSEYHMQILGVFNILNALPAIIIGRLFQITPEVIVTGIQSLHMIPGRMEIITHEPFTVIVDYAHEKLSMNALLDTAKGMKKELNNKIIVLFGAQGGGRDKEKRKWMGYAAGEKADIVILTSDDSYEETPESIIADISQYVQEKGKQENINLFLIADRRQAIQKAFQLATKNDIVLLTGKGAEQFMITNEGNIPWDDRAVAREELKKLSTHI